MRAAVMTAPGAPLSIETVEPLGLGEYDALVRVAASGICQTDRLRVDGHAAIDCPVVLGHEGAGVVEEVGRRVTRVAPGDRVVGTWVPACGSCFWCARGESNLCQDFGSTGAIPRLRRADGTQTTAFTGLGTFADAMVVHERSLVRVESDLPFEELALLGCGVMTGVGAAINTAQVAPGSSVAVIGCGAVGQAVVQGARIAGAARIVAIDPLPERLDSAVAAGATDRVDPNGAEVEEAVRALTAGRGADYVFDAAGLEAGLAGAFAMTRRGGTLVLVGVSKAPAALPWTTGEHLVSERRVLGCLYGSANMRRDIPRLIALIEAGRLDVGAMVSRRIRLDDVDAGLASLADGGVTRSVIVN